MLTWSFVKLREKRIEEPKRKEREEYAKSAEIK